MITVALAKKLGALGLCGWLLQPLTATATTITIDAGYLRGRNGVTLTAANTSNASSNGGALLLLVASGSSTGTTFTAPGAGQFVAGGDTIVGYVNTQAANGSTNGTNGGFEFNNNGGTQTAAPATGQETLNLLSNITTPAVPNASAYLELRWYPSITLAQFIAGATPAAGSYYGAYNPVISNSADASAMNLNPDGGQAWTLTTASNVTLNFFTTDDQGGSQPLTEGYANTMVPIPEPSSGVLGGLALVVIAGAHSLRRRLKTV